MQLLALQTTVILVNNSVQERDRKSEERAQHMRQLNCMLNRPACATWKNVELLKQYLCAIRCERQQQQQTQQLKEAVAKAAGRGRAEGRRRVHPLSCSSQKREANYNACFIMEQHNGANRTLKHGAWHFKGVSAKGGNIYTTYLTC